MRKADWKSVLVWIAVFILTLAVMGWVSRMESDRQLKQDAEHTAIGWFSAFTQAVPKLDAVFTATAVSPGIREQMSHMPKVTGVLTFRLFDRTGRLVLASSDLDNSDNLVGNGAQPGARETISASTRQRVLAGVRQTELTREAWRGEPALLGDVYLPVQQAGKPLGMIQVRTDQTQRAINAAQGLNRIAVIVSVLLLGIGSAATYQYVLRLRKQRLAEKSVRYLASHDALSDTLNRASFNKALGIVTQRTAQHEPAFALLRIDLDRFKEINDSLGHAQGDEVLRLVTQRLKKCLREKDVLSRLGGDEFSILLMGEASRATTTPIVKKICEAVALPMELSGQKLSCGASIGIALFGTDGTDPDYLLSKADQALFRAKSNGRGTFEFYDDTLDRHNQAKRELARELRLAIQDQQLMVYYQPQYGSDGDLLVGYEALVRWKHPSRGMVSPGEFIPLAEEVGLIDEIGLWVMGQACKDAMTWPSTLCVAVNLSVNQFASGKLVKQVARALQDSRLPPQRLGLEITESLLMVNSEQTLETLRQLAALGTSIAMDDFGTGYSSLAYLWRFPFDKVKIDQVFTRNLAKDEKVAMIVRSIITLAHSLDVRVNAEGVETREQMRALQSLGCDELQGFLLGKPGPARDLTHIGHANGRTWSLPRGEVRESLFATIPMDLPVARLAS